MNQLPLLKDYLASPFGLYRLDDPRLEKLKNYLCDKSNIDRLIRAIVKNVAEGSSHTSLQTVIEGHIYPIDRTKLIQDLLNAEDVFAVLNSLHCSVKLAGLQNTDPVIREFANDLYREHGYSLFSNMYITPADNRNCYTYHVDPHKVFFIHLMGEKTWYFPLEKDGSQLFFPEVFGNDEHQEHEKIRVLKVKPGESYYVSKGIVHKAKNESSGLNIHVTFPIGQPDQFYLLKHFLKDVLKLSKSDIELLNAPCDDQSLKRVYELLLAKLETADGERIRENYLTIQKMKNLYTLKLGRPYEENSRQSYASLFMK